MLNKEQITTKQQSHLNSQEPIPQAFHYNQFILRNITYMLASTSLDLIFQIEPIQIDHHRRIHVDRDGICTHDTLYARNANLNLYIPNNYCMMLQHRIHGPIYHVHAHDGSPIFSTILEPLNCLCLLSFFVAIKLMSLIRIKLIQCCSKRTLYGVTHR